MSRHFSSGNRAGRAREALPETDGVPREKPGTKAHLKGALGTSGLPKRREGDGEEGDEDTMRTCAWLRAWLRDSVWDSQPQIGATPMAGRTWRTLGRIL